MLTPEAVTIDIFEDIIQEIEAAQGEAGFRVYGKPPFKHLKSYPQIKSYTSSRYASFEFGLDGHDWLEVHKCPVCKKEYSFDNSDY